MIALFLFAAQAAASGRPPPAAASAVMPVGEQWELDQIRFQPPTDTTALAPAIAAAHSMQAVVDVLNQQHIAFQRGSALLSPSELPEAVRQQILALPSGEPFVLPLPQFTTVNLLVARRRAGSPAAGLTVPSSAPLTSAAASPVAIAAAEDLLRETHAEEQMRTAIEQGVAAMRAGVNLNAEIDRNDVMKLQRAKNPQAWDAAIAKVGGLQADVMAKLLGDLLPELHRRAVAAYAENYSVAEMRQLIAFYRSPVGRKSIERSPAIVTATGVWFQREFAQRVAPALAALQPEVQRTLGPLMPQPGK